jgi:hypothetical protein
MRYSFRKVEAWPPLAWLARCTPLDDVVVVYHGSKVETGPDWFCEAVWDGDFDAGDLDRTDIIFGSGGRRRGSHTVFVSSSATVDRLQFLELQGRVFVSNSLACLLAATQTELAPAYPKYMAAVRSIVRGLTCYQRSLPSSQGQVSLSYAENLSWDGRELRREPKSWRTRDFSTFDSYIGFLHDVLARLVENMSAASRGHRFRLLGTISQGYDSPMIVALARKHGLSKAISFREGRAHPLREHETPLDTGDRIARVLGVDVIVVPRDAWRQAPSSAELFLAGDANGQEILFRGGERWLQDTIVLTGMSGDTVWSKSDKAGSGLLARGDQSGLSLTEYRLHAGFLHVPVPFIGASQIGAIRALSNSAELADWSVPGDYDRPICRRVVEEAGVPRSAFGTSKVAASVRLSLRSRFWSSGFHDDLLCWLRSNRACWLRRGRLPPDLTREILKPAQDALALLVRVLLRLPGATSWGRRIIRRLDRWAGRELLYKYVFAWAVSRSKTRYLLRCADFSTEEDVGAGWHDSTRLPTMVEASRLEPGRVTRRTSPS